MNTIKCICDLYNEDFAYYKDFKYVNWIDVKSWDFDELTLASRDYINNYFNQPRFFNRVEFMDNAEEVLPVLANHYDIKVVSMGYSPNLHGKENFIKEYMPYVTEFIGVNFKQAGDKAHIDMSNGIFIDDSVTNLNTSNAKEKYVFGDIYPWNENKDYKRFYNWYEVLDALTEKKGR